ncbi:hypothetical protein MMC24_004181 [Lignoscripta atroalba]|nr:hypothetical protein [Lignoscripta atroalba]
MEDHEDEDVPQLSGTALAALQDFYAERDVREKRFEDLKSTVQESRDNTTLSMEMFTEDWNASQFWYSDDTATILAKQLLEGATRETSIAVVSAPSVFIQMKNLLASQEPCTLFPKGLWRQASQAHPTTSRVCLLEFDGRFGVFKEFVHYDFQSPLKLPGKGNLCVTIPHTVLILNSGVERQF